MPKDIRVHIDTLEYTRAGLKTTERLRLEVGQHNRIVLVRPDRVRPSGESVALFGPSTAFPGPPVVAMFLSIKTAQTIGGWFAGLFAQTQVQQTGVIQVFGHADAVGDDNANKTLSERRAEIFTALLLGDVDRFIAAAAQESWGLGEHQAMLRVLQCDPGPIDAEPGPLTEAAVQDFQSDYVHGFFHAESEQTPRNPTLAVDGDLGPQTEDALLEAFTIACSPRIDPARMHPSHPSVGCASFNWIHDDAPELNRRVSLVVHPSLPVHHERAPCTEGDHAACPFDDRARSGCLWFREHVADLRKEDCQHAHYDLRWLPLPNGRVLLSALTTLPDGAEVNFQVFRSKPVVSADEVGLGDLGEALSDRAVGLVRNGVAQRVWDPGELDVFDSDAWFEGLSWELTVSEPDAAWDTDNQLRVPVFRVDGAEVRRSRGPLRVNSISCVSRKRAQRRRPRRAGSSMTAGSFARSR